MKIQKIITISWLILLLAAHSKGQNGDESVNNNPDEDEEENNESGEGNFNFLEFFFNKIKDILRFFLDSYEFPEHQFCTKENIIQTGPKSGTKRFLTTLLIPPYTFRRKTNYRNVGAKDVFCCTGCENRGYNNIAHGVVKDLVDGKPEYELVLVPNHHECAPTPVQHLIKLFSKRCYEAVAIVSNYLLKYVKKN